MVCVAMRLRRNRKPEINYGNRKRVFGLLAFAMPSVFFAESFHGQIGLW